MHRIAILCLLGVLSLSVVLAANTCTQTGPGFECCDVDTLTVKNSGDYCGAESDCTQQRTCDGVNPTCPTVPKANSAGTKCSAAANRCKNDGVCDAAGNCLAQTTKANGATCIAASDSTCDAVRTCTNGVCSPRTPAGNTVTCHTNTSICDTTVKCPAANSATPYTCTKRATGPIVCRPLIYDDCKEEVNCPGNSNSLTYEQRIVCPPQVYSVAGKTCYPGYPNAQPDVCAGYQCAGGRSGCDTIRPNSIDAGADCSAQQSCTNGQTALCRSTGVCGQCRTRTPGGTNDPLIAGFRQQRFWLEGVSGTNYNMYSQPGMTMNALIINAHSKTQKIQTVMGEIAFITKNNIVYITPKSGKNGTITVNGKSVQLSAKANLYDLDDCVQMAWSPKSVLFSSPEFEIIIAFMDASKVENLNIDYLNIKIPRVSGDVTKMSGIIGQTAHELNNIDKNWTDFEVSDLYAHDSPKNTFDASALACETSESSKRSVGKFETATQSEVDDMMDFANPMI